MIVEILDVERVLADIIPPTTQISDDIIEKDLYDMVQERIREVYDK